MFLGVETMRTSKLVLIVLCTLLLLLILGAKCEKDDSGTDDGREPGIRDELLDLSEPGSWDLAVKNEHERARKIAEKLISIAQDKQRPNDDRRRAINLLARLGNDKSLEFLVANIDIYIPLEKIKGDEDEIRQRPCTYALSGIRSGIMNWNVVPLILAQLREPTVNQKAKLIDFAFILGAVCGERTAHAIIGHEVSVASEESIRANFEMVLKYL
jgi:hypothetical protein